MNEKKESINGILSLLFLALIIYGSVTNFYIPKHAEHDIKVLGVDVVEVFPSAFTITDKDATFLTGIQNGIALSGEVIWNSIKNVWKDYTDFPDNFLFKIIWLFVGIPIEIIKWLLLMIPVFLVALYQLITIESSFTYKAALFISSLLPFAIFVFLGKDEE
jgi:hypothetical protein